MRRALVLQAQHDAPPGLLADWAQAREIALDVVHVDRRPRLPAPQDYAFAVALGSDASLAGTTAPAWVADEVRWLCDAEAGGVPVLGICFGAQALAVAHGGRVDRLPMPEIGWIQIDSADEEHLPRGPWLAWHEDLISLPPLAYELGHNGVGPQAFCVGRHLGVQFHPEVTPPIVAAWADAGGRQLATTGISRGELEAQTRDLAPAAATAALRLFDGFAARAGLGPGIHAAA
jgi:GMP synthase-like glutamine amidotransferase